MGDVGTYRSGRTRREGAKTKKARASTIKFRECLFLQSLPKDDPRRPDLRPLSDAKHRALCRAALKGITGLFGLGRIFGIDLDMRGNWPWFLSGPSGAEPGPRACNSFEEFQGEEYVNNPAAHFPLCKKEMALQRRLAGDLCIPELHDGDPNGHKYCTRRQEQFRRNGNQTGYPPIPPRLSVMEYVCMLGDTKRDYILKSLLAGGASPALGNDEALRKIFDGMDPLAQTWIAKHLCRMYLWGAGTRVGNGLWPECASCGRETRGFDGLQDVSMSTCAQWPTCKHNLCFGCVWGSLCTNVERYEGSSDIESASLEVVCPVCRERQPDDLAPPELCTSLPHSRTPDDIKQTSWAEFRKLPLTDAEMMAQIFVQVEISEKGLAGTSSKHGRDKAKKTKMKRMAKKEVFKALPPAMAAGCFIGESQESRQTKFWEACLRQGQNNRLLWLINAGVGIDLQDEYGRTALHMAAALGIATTVETLLRACASTDLKCHLGLDAIQSAAANGHGRVLQVFQKYGHVVSDAMPDWFPDSKSLVTNRSANTTFLIDPSDEHPGASALMIDGAFSEDFLAVLSQLCATVPNATLVKDKESCSDRSYLMDAAGWISEAIAAALNTVDLTFTGKCSKAFSHMRFLKYSKPGEFLAPHVDLSRTNPQGERSTHTFILYLDDCSEGGETALLTKIPPIVQLRGEAQPSCRDAPEEYVIAAVKPKRGRLLIFPHQAPHEGRTVVSVPKTLLRGELV